MLTRRIFLISAAALPLIPAAATAVFAASPRRSGRFKGESGHVTSGTVEITHENGQTVVMLKADFSFDGAPDPKVALGRDGYDSSTILGPLAANVGAQSYDVPAAIDPDAYNEVWIWCEQYNVPLGLARIN
ncbi:MAG: DM13 domain-containing protein [Paracoccaceae bacterium]